VSLIIEDVLYNLKNDEKFSKKVIRIEEIKSRSAKICNLDDLPYQLSNFLKKEEIKLFKHQCKLASLVRDGKNVIITTPTASGKTLAFSLPIMETFTKDEKATALFMYPTIALIADQRYKLAEYEEKTGIRIDPYSYTSDTPPSMRAYIRENVRTLLTTPYMLHLILYWKNQWKTFFSNLKYVVIDEAHEYSGVFGSNVALLIRRLRRICNFFGSDPQFILSSATLANPLEFSEQLVGKKFELVDNDTSFQGNKQFILYNPFNDKDHPSIMRDTRDIFSMFVLNDIQTLCFMKTKKDAERIVSMVKRYFKKEKPELMDCFASYRAGYTTEDRRSIEYGLQCRELMGVSSTNALELGVDIGSLDAVIISGYPGTLMSTWQQAGRAGRGVKDSIVVFLASNDPLNQYIVKNPDYILGKSHEHATVDLNNDYLLKKHLLCAISELDLTKEDLVEYFNLDESYMANFEDKRTMFNGNSWEYTGPANNSPAYNDPLKYIPPTTFQVIFEGKVLESLTDEDAYAMAFVGAVYRHKGRKYVVKDFDLYKKVFSLQKKQEKTDLDSWKKTEIKNPFEIKNKHFKSIKLHFGEIEVIKSFFTYKKINNERKNFKKLNVPPISFKTKALWFDIPHSIIDQIKKIYDYDVVDQSIDGFRNALTTMFPIHVLCNRCDLLGYYDPKHSLNHTIYFYDQHPGGVGLAEKCLETFVDLCKVTLDMVKSCKCKDGCVFCVHSAPCGSRSKKVNKNGTILLLKKILQDCGETVIDEPIEKHNVVPDLPDIIPDIDQLEKNNDIQGIIKSLDYNDEKIRVDAAYALGEIKDPIAVEPLIKVLINDPSEWVRLHAARSLGEIGDMRAKTPLQKRLTSDKDSEVKIAIKRALSKLSINKSSFELKSNPTENKIKTNRKNTLKYAINKNQVDSSAKDIKGTLNENKIKSYKNNTSNSSINKNQVKIAEKQIEEGYRKIIIKNRSFNHYYLGYYHTWEQYGDKRNILSQYIANFKFKTGEIHKIATHKLSLDVINLINTKKLTFDVIVPIPSSKAGLISEGSKLVTSNISQAFKIENGTGILKRIKSVKESHKHGTRPISEHLKTITCENYVQNKRVILFDDIYTHGNTAAACITKVLEKNPSNITLITLGKTPVKVK
jgi:DEAD/DEAH box helicase domain-containing protein